MHTGKLIQELNDIRSSIERISEIAKGDKSELSNVKRVDDEWLKIQLHKYIQNRQLRHKIFGHNIFSDPSWDILVELFYSKLTSKEICLSGVTSAGETPPTTGLRHFGLLEQMGLAERQNHASDKRRVSVRMTDEGFAQTREFFARAMQP